MTVIATISEAKRDTMKDMPSGLSILPSRSPNKKEEQMIIIISVAFHIDDLGSVEAYTLSLAAVLFFRKQNDILPEPPVNVFHINYGINKRAYYNSHTPRLIGLIV